MKTLRIGTRASALALVQTDAVAERIRKCFPDLVLDIIRIQTTGDKILDAPLSKIGVKSLFTKEIEEALLANKIDMAVHSLKDLPTELPAGLEIGAVLKREDPHDALVAEKRATLKSLPKGARVGTSSLRRAAQIKAQRPDLEVGNLRGNLDTRLKKLSGGEFDAIILAQAGLDRIKAKVNATPIPFEQMLPAVGQGFLAVEVRDGDKPTAEIVRTLEDAQSKTEAICERAFLRALEGGCQVPIGALAQSKGSEIALEGIICSLDGKTSYRKKISGKIEDAEKIGRDLAQILLNMGGDKILESIRN